MQSTSSNGPEVFISYSRQDRDHLKRLKVHLAMYERTGQIDYWDDSRLQAGDRWREEISRAIQSAKVAVLLVTQDFLASRFIADNELPPLLEKAQREGTTILSVMVGPSHFSDTPLAEYQTIGNPSKPLIALNKYQRERLWIDVVRAIKEALDRNGPSPEISSPTSASAGTSQSSAQHVRDEMGKAVEQLDNESTGHGNAVFTGLKGFDSLLSGLQRSMLYLVAGEAGVGKTGFALFLAYNAARKFGASVDFVSMAEDSGRIAVRLLSMDSGVDLHKMRSGYVDDDEWERISESIGRLMEMPIFIDDTPSLTASGLATKVREAGPQPVDLIVIDYLQLLGSSCRDRAERADELVDIGRELKILARTLDVPVVVTVQTPPIRVWPQGDYHDLLLKLSKACGAVNDADAVLFLHRDDLQNPDTDRRNVVDIVAAKHRHGPTGMISLYGFDDRMRYMEFELPDNENEA